jgi:hypothetical protein
MKPDDRIRIQHMVDAAEEALTQNNLPSLLKILNEILSKN